MQKRRYWITFGVSSVAWLVLSAVLAPNLSGTDVFMFRDAGWNLGAYGSFDSAALPYSHDLAPHLFAHYTPMMPLLFAAYIKLLSGNSYAGTFFNLLLGLVAAALALRTVLALPASRWREVAAFLIALLPVLWITYDRPEALGLILFLVTVQYTLSPHPRAALVGLLVALTFLAHPFAAVITAVWCVLLLVVRFGERANKGSVLKMLGVMSICAALPVAAVALLYWSLDPSSLGRFAQHALGPQSGLGRTDLLSDQGKRTLGRALYIGAFQAGPLTACLYSLTLLCAFLSATWSLYSHKRFSEFGLWVGIAASLSLAVSILAFPAQSGYIFLLAFALPLGALEVCHRVLLPGRPWLAILILALLAHVPGTAVSVIQRVEQIGSYRAAEDQPRFLRAHLASPESIVAIQGDEYDVYKPYFRHLVPLTSGPIAPSYSALAAIANCYDYYRSAAGSVRPLPQAVHPGDFRLIEAAPEHLWITVLGRRVMRAQWGYGCDLYTRIREPSTLSASR